MDRAIATWWLGQIAGLDYSLLTTTFPSRRRPRTVRELVVFHFAWRVEQLVQEGGFALICGESGTGKSVALRIVAQRLAALRDVMVGVVERPQSKSGDFYRELGDIFSVQLRPSNRWGGFRALRERWKARVAATRIRPVLLVDEAQEMEPGVLSELRILASADFDSASLLTVTVQQLCDRGACPAVRLNWRLAACLLWPVPAVQPNAQRNSVAEASRWHVPPESVQLLTCLRTESDLPSVAFED